METISSELMEFLQCAEKNRLRYLVIGGHAVNFYGYHRFTEDFDIWIAPTNENKKSFLHTLKCLEYNKEDLQLIEAEDFTKHFKCTIGTPPDLIDVLTIVHKDISYDVAEKNRELIFIQKDIPIYFISFEDLKEIKIRSQRPKDWEDITKLELLRKNNK
ncbi:MAG: DUF6036 family nucleotidyltransferase [Saprospiraceae bacterium]